MGLIENLFILGRFLLEVVFVARKVFDIRGGRCCQRFAHLSEPVAVGGA